MPKGVKLRQNIKRQGLKSFSEDLDKKDGVPEISPSRKIERQVVELMEPRNDRKILEPENLPEEESKKILEEDSSEEEISVYSSEIEAFENTQEFVNNRNEMMNKRLKMVRIWILVVMMYQIVIGLIDIIPEYYR